ncbi:unnamed protein product [Blepharisma stoltei]|uniref:Uncharacterized protein n=1 Tax=Blepharisma stoltei TaxID=1481888 RepID=A0AAU9K2D3_9CILI|nr:unnamed protein product [Blepharisma stoltei]
MPFCTQLVIRLRKQNYLCSTRVHTKRNPPLAEPASQDWLHYLALAYNKKILNKKLKHIWARKIVLLAQGGQ